MQNGVKAVKERNAGHRNTGVWKARSLLPLAAAIGGACGIAAFPAGALELGELRMESTLGQPLRASIAFALNPNEQVMDYCVSLRPGAPDGFIPSVTRASISVAGNRIILIGNAAVMDPLLNVRIAIDCPYTPDIIREYTAIVDPALPDEAPVPVAAAPAVIAAPAAAVAPIERSRAASPAVVETDREIARPVAAATEALPIQAGSEYRVRTGDTASAIAARISGRSATVAATVNALVTANPQAFDRGDANRIMAGSLLTIPGIDSVVADQPVAMRQTAVAARTALADAEAISIHEPVVTPASPAAAGPATAAAVAPTVALPASGAEPVAANLPAEPEPIDEIAVTEAIIEPAAPTMAEKAATPDEATVETVTQGPDAPATDELKPGDVIVKPPQSVGARTAPAVVTPAPRADETVESGSRWLGWTLYGTGAIALLGGLIFFGRGALARFSSKPVGPSAAPAENEEPDTAEVPRVVVDDVDFVFEDTINSRSISLDADLDDGSGLGDSDAMDVAQDFTFDPVSASTREIDLEIPEGAEKEPVRVTTDIIPPSHRIEELSILDTEVAPEPDDYDVSMIVDATKQSLDDYDLTAKDLHAFEIGDDAATGEYSISGDTLASDADLKTLERDYEEEFTMTQALNQEIVDAARELAKKLDGDQLADTLDVDLNFELDPTAQMPATATEQDETADTGEITARLIPDLPADAVNDDIADDEITARFAAAGGDATVEMPRDRGKPDPAQDA